MKKDWDFRDGLQLLANLPNVYLKISSFGEIACNEKTGISSEILEYFVDLIKLFTPRRCMFGTNFPEEHNLENGLWTMKGLVIVFKQISAKFTKVEQKRLWSKTGL